MSRIPSTTPRSPAAPRACTRGAARERSLDRGRDHRGDRRRGARGLERRRRLDRQPHRSGGRPLRGAGRAELRGHDFVADALKRGAGGALVSRRPDGVPADAPLVLVPDTLAALTALGRSGRDRCTARVIAVTGSVGKTGTKEALRRALERQGPTVASAASLNNHWGVPLSLARMPADTAYGVFEIGMNHPGEVAALTRLVRPDVAVITTISPAHLGFFPSVEAIADAKAEIFQGMSRDGVAVLNRDNAHFERLAAAARACGVTRVLGFGEHAEAAV